ncbi:hypothetical protein [Acidihalobacter aeolianus]|nr:hypothetical protein [Acidihalobacter aeolianus]
MTRLPVNPELLSWVRERAALDTLALAGRWRSGATTPGEGTHE